MALFFKHWNPTEIAAMEWQEEQRRKTLNKAIATASEILAKHFGEKGESGPPVTSAEEDREYEAFCKAQAAAEEKGEILSFDQWQESIGVPVQYIGDT